MSISLVGGRRWAISTSLWKERQEALTLERRLRKGSEMLFAMECKGQVSTTEYRRLLDHFLALLSAYELASARAGYPDAHPH